MKLVIVESPAKCGKIQGFLGAGYQVVATMGHIRALEESLDSVGIDRNWEPKYAELATKKDAILKLKRAAKGADVILATDDDREGEGIAWHVASILNLNPANTPRIVFHEITQPAILAAVNNPRRLDLNKVAAQQARSMLDLLVGFTISKVLWNRVAPKLSAGRCQTPALRLVVERDLIVDMHRPEASWRLSGTWAHPSDPAKTIPADATQELKTEQEATQALQKVYTNTETKVIQVKETVSISQPPKPLITSTLQQEASSLHGLNPKATMMAAQKLYEAGHITYMRTDNPLLSQEAATAIRTYVQTTYGEPYLGPAGQHTIQPTTAAPTPAKKTKAKPDAAPQPPEAQAAHEAIRPTHPETPNPPIEDDTQKTVYALIWRRATQSQMSPSQTDVRKATLALTADPTRQWTTEQTKLKFAGYKILERQDPEKHAKEEAEWLYWALKLAQNTILNWTTLKADEVFTKPKGRYTEASLISELEKKGIGRPSTFASLVSTIMDRNYVEKTNTDGKIQDSHHLALIPNTWPPTQTLEHHKVGADKNKLSATALGKSVSEFLSREYNDLFNYEFTAAMEQKLDAVAKAEQPWKSVLQQTWDTYKERYTAMTTGGNAANKAAKERTLAESIKVILSRKGPLFVKEAPAGADTKATFAPLPPSVTFESATLLDATAAFAAAQQAQQGELIGMLETQEIRKKKGPYGWYVVCGTTNVSLKGSETLEEIQDKLKAKISFATTETAYSRQVGDFIIKKGPYGLYFYKHALVKKTFVKFPAISNAETITATDLATLYSAGIKSKRRAPPKKD
uniref:DNA topoisomerase n=1 Tax=viral metagenome TaxID=1070528 RepID=A0A6C0LQ19_9ZZZZ